MGTPVKADLKDRKVWCTFDYDPRVVEMMKRVPGHRFVPKEKGGPGWQFPLDLATARILWKVVGQDLKVEPELKRWADKRVGAERELSSLALADAAPLSRLPDILPDLWRALHVGPKGRGLSVKELNKLIKAYPEGSFQSADTRYLARASNPLNGNQPGLGKTLETIGAIFEASEEHGPHLVLAPKTSLETVWKEELERWQPYPVWVAMGSGYQREVIIEDFLCTDGPGWLICNHHMAQMTRTELKDGTVQYTPKFPQLFEVEWANVILDEVHKAGFRDTNSLMYRGCMALHAIANKKYALSGTPVGGKPMNLWHILHWLEPDEFSNKWHWAEQWCEIRDNNYGKVVERIRRDKEEEFYKFHAPYFLRRLKEEVLTDLPPKQEVDVWVDMVGKQAKQYTEMALAAEVKIEDEELTAFGILAEYTRLKQFSDSACKIITKQVHGETVLTLQPTEDSAKLEALEQILDERGIFEGERGEQVVVFSQFSSMIDMVTDWLVRKGVDVLKLTGATSQKDRAAHQRTFQGKEAQVLCMTTTAGGVAITLDAADTVVFLDETWDPGDQEQASDRVHRASRIHQVTVYTIRSKGSIEEYIQRVLLGKENVNKIILDLRRMGLRATGIEDAA